MIPWSVKTPNSITAGQTKVRCSVELVNMAKIVEYLHCAAIHLHCLRSVSLPSSLPGFADPPADGFCPRLDVAPPLWTALNMDLGISFDDLNNGYAAGLAGLATAAILLIPLCVKYGRRSMYIGTSAALLASVIWMAKQNTRLDYIWNNFLSGIAGSLGDILVQLTVRNPSTKKKNI